MLATQGTQYYLASLTELIVLHCPSETNYNFARRNLKAYQQKNVF